MTDRHSDQEVIYFYDKTNLTITLDWKKGEDLFENRERHGYKKNQIGNPSFCNDSLPVFEIFHFYHPEKNVSICELLDCNGKLFKFACDNQITTFKLIKEFISFAKDLCIIEYNLKKCYEENDI